jgi:histone chaperone ASF1
MHQIQIDNIAITNPKSHITDPIHIAITFSALEALPHPLTWKLIYVGSAFTETHDQTLE